MSDFATKLAGEQRGRLVASILTHAEREVYPKLTAAECKAFREKVLASVGVYHDFVLDCLHAAGDGAVVNEDAMRLLRSIQTSLVRDRHQGAG
jgi:hypothetical protein